MKSKPLCRIACWDPKLFISTRLFSVHIQDRTNHKFHYTSILRVTNDLHNFAGGESLVTYYNTWSNTWFNRSIRHCQPRLSSEPPIRRLFYLRSSSYMACKPCIISGQLLSICEGRCFSRWYKTVFSRCSSWFSPWTNAIYSIYNASCSHYRHTWHLSLLVCGRHTSFVRLLRFFLLYLRTTHRTEVSQAVLQWHKR